MSILKESDIEILKKELSGLTGPVKLINFTQQIECQYCRETNEIVQELTRISDKITYETHDFITEQDAVNKYKVDKIPAIVVMGADDHGIRFYGIPSGYEFVSLLDAIRMVSSGQSGLGQRTRQILARLNKPLHLQVFVTPT